MSDALRRKITKEMRKTGMSMEDAIRLTPIIYRRDVRIKQLEKELKEAKYLEEILLWER